MKENRKPYEPPTLRKPTQDQATLFLTGHAYLGDNGARELLELWFADPAMPADQDPIPDTCGTTATAPGK